MTLSTYLRNGLIGYTISTCILGLFAYIYEILGHGVYSNRIRLAFIPCFIMFVLFFIFKKNGVLPYLPALTALRILVLNETIRNILYGIFEVYGTSFSKMKYFDYLSIALILVTFVLSFVGVVVKIKSSKKSTGSTQA